MSRALSALAAASALLLSGCGGSDGANGVNGTNGVNGVNGTNGTNAVATTNAAVYTADQWAGLSLSGKVLKVDMSQGTPVVTFSLADGGGTPLVGMAQKNASGAYQNFSFGLAKLMPADPVTKYPSRWVNYFVVSTPAAGKTAVPMFPEPENNGTMVDNGDGTYTYTFALDVTKAKSYADAATTYDATHLKSDLDDLTYNPNLPHRLIIAVGGMQGAATTPVKHSANLTFDFVPATGKAPAATDPQRTIVDSASCNGCHSDLTLHEARIPAMHDTKMCVVCHTEQVKYGSGDSMPASGTTLVPNGSYAAYGATLRLMDRALPNFPNMVHHLHMGEKLYYQGYNQFGTMYNEVTYPQPITNCVKCHDGSSSAAVPTPQGDNWKSVPSRLACGACHDGINFATGKGSALGTTGQLIGGHVGGAQSSDANCAVCHDAASIPVYHVTVDATGANARGGYPLNTAQDVPTPGFPAGQGPTIPLASLLNPPAGLYKMSFELKQVTVSGAAGAKKATAVYRILKDGQPVTFNSSGYLITGVDGTPDIYIAYATPQDGIAAPADWNSPTTASAHVIDIRDGKNGNSQTGPDANGYYTAKLGFTIPDNATMVTGALGINYNGFVQLNLPDYPKGIRLREPQFQIKLADGYSARRTIVANAKCNNCHGQLGVDPSFHSGARNNGEGCAICHNANNSTGHTGAANNFGGGWSVGIKNFVHSIHGSAKRTQPFNYDASADNPNGFQRVTYPGILNNCEQCHVPGSYDYSAAANAAAVPNLLWTTDAKYDMSNPTNAPSLGLSPWINILGQGQVNYTSDNLVSSPIASACFGCHDSMSAVGHMQANGGAIYARASTVSNGGRANGFTKVEQCLVCHGTGKVADIKVVHGVGQ